MKINKLGKFFIGLGIAGGVLIGGTAALYLKGLPYVVSHPKFINYVQESAKKYVDADLILEKPELHTSISPLIGFKVGLIELKKDNKKLLELDNFNTEISFRKILGKTIIVKRLVAKNIYADVNALEKLIPQQEEPKKEQKNDWNVDIFDALLGVRNAEILYSIDNDTHIHLNGHNIGVNNAEKVKKNVYFQLLAKVARNENHVTIELNDNGQVYFEDNHFHVDSCPLRINKSDIFINLLADKKQNFDIDLYSKNLNLADIIEFLETQVIENNINDILAIVSDIKGNVDFNIKIKNDDIKGDFNINNVKFKVKDVDNLPVTLTRGAINMTTQDITLKDFEGYYDSDSQNKIDFKGTVKDYLNTMEMDIVGNAIARNDFFKNHLTKLAGTDMEIKGEAPTRLMLKSKNNIFDFVWLFMLKPGQNIKVANEYLPFEDTVRIMESNMHFENMIFDIKSLDYHMIPADKIPPKKGEGPRPQKPQPIFRLSSKIDIAHNSDIKFVGFEIPQELPSELLNVILKQEMFKRGKISGKLLVDNTGSYPVLDGNMKMDKVIIPSQMTFVKEASLHTENGLIRLDASGGYRRAKFNFNGDIVNAIKFPIVVKDVNFSLENLDLYKLMEAFNNPETAENVIKTDTGTIKVENHNAEEFDIRNLIIEKCRFHLDKGNYKDATFANLDADLTLDKDGIIDVKSNRFDFIDGHSSLAAKFDLINKLYNIKLGVLNAESNIIAKSLLDLDGEICGKGSGFLNITTDESMKLSGTIKFRVLDGKIEKIGLVEYVLKFAALFRNPITMVSPGIFADILNIPDGTFEKITGDMELKKNVVTRINIKSYSPDLSTYITGRYNLDNGDTSLRIYTKFSNAKRGFAGFLNKLSLNALANRIPLSSRNDAHYYEMELKEIPDIDADEKDCQVFLTRVEGDVVNNNYISSLKKIK